VAVPSLGRRNFVTWARVPGRGSTPPGHNKSVYYRCKRRIAVCGIRNNPLEKNQISQKLPDIFRCFSLFNYLPYL